MTGSQISGEMYTILLKDLLGRDPQKIKDANRVLYKAATIGAKDGTTEPDLILAEAAVNS